MPRKLKHHEQKLLRKVNFVEYGADEHRGAQVIRRYNLKGDHYEKYNRICGVSPSHLSLPPPPPPRIKPHKKTQEQKKKANKTQSLRKLAHLLSALPPEDPIRNKHETLLLDKLYDMGILSTKSKLSSVENSVTVSAFARRRLPVVMTRLHMAENVTAATKLIEQGHVRCGTETITDPAYLVSRSREDFITWVTGSKIQRTILKYRDKLDDFDLL